MSVLSRALTGLFIGGFLGGTQLIHLTATLFPFPTPPDSADEGTLMGYGMARMAYAVIFILPVSIGTGALLGSFAFLHGLWFVRPAHKAKWTHYLYCAYGCVAVPVAIVLVLCTS